MATSKHKPVTKAELQAALKNYPTKDDLKAALKNYPTKAELKAEIKKCASKEALDIVARHVGQITLDIGEIKQRLANTATKDDLAAMQHSIILSISDLVKTVQDSGQRIEDHEVRITALEGAARPNP